MMLATCQLCWNLCIYTRICMTPGEMSIDTAVNSWHLNCALILHTLSTFQNFSIYLPISSFYQQTCQNYILCWFLSHVTKQQQQWPANDVIYTVHIQGFLEHHSKKKWYILDGKFIQNFTKTMAQIISNLPVKLA